MKTTLTAVGLAGLALTALASPAHAACPNCYTEWVAEVFTESGGAPTAAGSVLAYQSCSGCTQATYPQGSYYQSQFGAGPDLSANWPAGSVTLPYFIRPGGPETQIYYLIAIQAQCIITNFYTTGDGADYTVYVSATDGSSATAVAAPGDEASANLLAGVPRGAGAQTVSCTYSLPSNSGVDYVQQNDGSYTITAGYYAYSGSNGMLQPAEAREVIKQMFAPAAPKEG